jgi:hypothetical protein
MERDRGSNDRGFSVEFDPGVESRRDDALRSFEPLKVL